MKARVVLRHVLGNRCSRIANVRVRGALSSTPGELRADYRAIAPIWVMVLSLDFILRGLGTAAKWAGRITDIDFVCVCYDSTKLF